MTDQEVINLAAVVAFAIYLFLRRRTKTPPRRLNRPSHKGLHRSRDVVVDGSNVMHWNGEPSDLVLNRVLIALDQKGLNPMVFFDANAGYKLWDRHANARHMAEKIGVKAGRVVVVPSGTTADELLLEFAIKHGLRVVSNDRFLDWRVNYPQINEKGFLVKGTWRQGSVMLRGL